MSLGVGRPRKPLEIHVQQGTFRDDRHLPDVASAQAVSDIPMPPLAFGSLRVKLKRGATDEEKQAALAAAERTKALHALWYDVCTALMAMRILTAADFIVVEMYCREVYIWRTAWNKAVEDDNSVIDLKTAKGTVKSQSINAWISLAMAAEKRALEIGAQLGLSPAARTKIGVRNSLPKDPMGKLLRK